MDFTLPPDLEELRQRVRRFVGDEVLPLEQDRDNYDAHENIRLDVLDAVRARAKAAGLWAPQSPKSRGGMGLPVVGWAAMYEEANRSIFGPACFNCAAPDDGNMILLNKVATEAQKDRWLQPIIDGKVRSAFVMTEPHPGGGSDPADDPHGGGEVRRQMGGQRPQMVHHRRLGGGSLHPDRPHLRRCAQGPDRLPVPPRPAGLADRAAHSRSWGRRNMAAIAS